MAKGKDKKLKSKIQAVSHPDAKKTFKKKKVRKGKSNTAVVPATLPLADTLEAHDLVPAIDGNGAISKGREEGKENINTLSGFIFMCNAKTKLECYQNRVFGLPAGKMEVVEKIKQGTKLFLFDFEVKLLYGIYEASSPGKLDLVPAAFGGKFRAQVRFEIYKDCLPLTEITLKTDLKDIYKGSKFTQELNDRQVKSLISLFRPIGASSSARLQPPEPNIASRWPVPSSAMDSQVPPLSVPPFVDPYLAGVIHGRPPSVQQEVLNSQNGWYGTTVSMDYAQPATEYKGLCAPGGPYRFTEVRQFYVPTYPSQTAQDPYLRYNRTVQEMFPQDRLAGPQSGYHQLAMQREREIVPHRDVTGYSSSYTMQTPAPQHVQLPAPQHVQPYVPEYVQPYVPEHVQPPAAAGRPGLSEGSTHISSFYAR